MKADYDYNVIYVSHAGGIAQLRNYAVCSLAGIKKNNHGEIGWLPKPQLIFSTLHMLERCPFPHFTFHFKGWVRSDVILQGRGPPSRLQAT